MQIKLIIIRLQFLHNVDELLEYRINKGYHFEDNDEIFIKPSTINGYNFIYKDMVNRNNMDVSQHESDEDSDIYDPSGLDEILGSLNEIQT
jgi:hypothetical protein